MPDDLNDEISTKIDVDEQTSIFVVFRGRIYVASMKKTFNCFLVVDRDHEGHYSVTDKERFYDRTSKVIKNTVIASPAVGGIYKVDISHNDSESIIPATARYVERLKDDDLIVKWTAIDTAE